MVNNTKENSVVSTQKKFWPLYFSGALGPFFLGGVYIANVSLSSIIWPGEDYHILEMGALFAVLFWSGAIAAIFFGIIVDRFSRKKMWFIILIVDSICIFLLGFIQEGQGIQTWWYVFVLISLYAFFAGGRWSAVISLSDDSVPTNQRSRFIAVFGTINGAFNIAGSIIISLTLVYDNWRDFFWWLGISMFISAFIFWYFFDEPKRAAQRDELSEVLRDDAIVYEFKINKETMKKTMLSKTNKIVLIEGIFTNILFSGFNLVMLPYLQNPPHNFSPLFISYLLAIFGGLGGLTGTIILSHISDKKAKDNPRIRITFIVVGLIAGAFSFLFLFFIPLPHLTEEQGQSTLFIMTFSIMWVVGILLAVSNSISVLYYMNQTPLIQEINLPEAQGKIASWNQFLESIGWGIGPLISAIVLTLSGTNYQITSIFISIFLIPGIILWFLSLKWYSKDKQMIKNILEERAEILKNNNNSNKKS